MAKNIYSLFLLVRELSICIGIDIGIEIGIDIEIGIKINILEKDLEEMFTQLGLSFLVKFNIPNKLN